MTNSKILRVVAVVGVIGAVSACGFADPASRVADYLVGAQLPTGNWGEGGFTGEVVTGLAFFTEGACNPASYKDAAEDGGSYILCEAGYNSGMGLYDIPLFGAEAYALTRLSEISGTPSSNSWRSAAGDFFTQIGLGTSTTDDFIDGILSDYGTAYLCTAVYDISRFTVASDYVDDSDKDVWRQRLIDALADVDDEGNAPVLALGAAVWALASTGVMDSTTVVTDESSSLFYNKTLSELPGMLADRQDDRDGSFFWSLGSDTWSGYTENTTMGALGLMAAYDSNASLFSYADDIIAAKTVLAEGVDSLGAVYFQIGDTGTGSWFYLGGETLEILGAPTMTGDLDGDCDVDGDDLDIILGDWGNTVPPGDPRADVDGDGDVDGDDLDYVLANWGAGTTPPVPEPMTLTLLGLGALALIRRKRRFPVQGDKGRDGRERAMHSQTKIGMVLVGAVICGLFVQSSAGFDSRDFFLLGEQNADAAMGFDPFTLMTLPSVGSYDDSTDLAPAPRTSGGSSPAPVSASSGDESPLEGAAVGSPPGPAPRMPVRPSFRSPYKP